MFKVKFSFKNEFLGITHYLKTKEPLFLSYEVFFRFFFPPKHRFIVLILKDSNTIGFVKFVVYNSSKLPIQLFIGHLL